MICSHRVTSLRVQFRLSTGRGSLRREQRRKGAERGTPKISREATRCGAFSAREGNIQVQTKGGGYERINGARLAHPGLERLAHDRSSVKIHHA